MQATKRQSDEATKGSGSTVFLFPPSLRRFVALSLLILPSCTHNTGGEEPSTLRQKQDQTVRDPINYKPDNENTQPYDISGGGINNFDSKAFNKDLHNVFDP